MRMLSSLSFQRFLIGALLFASVLSAQTLGQRFSILSQLAVGGGWNSDIFVNNQGASGVDGLEISFFDDNGDPLTVETPAGSFNQLTFGLDPGETRIIQATKTGAAQAGYAVLEAPTSSSIRATLLLRFLLGPTLSTGVGVAQQFPLSDDNSSINQHYSFPAEVSSERQVNTGLALANGILGDFIARDQTFIVSLIDQAGALMDTALLPVGVGEHTSLFLDDPRLFPELDNFAGTALVSATAPYGVLALRLEQALLSSVAINRGPVLAPFHLNSAPVGEQEPNSDDDTAQTLTPPVVVEGVIGEADDVDYFRFEAMAGDIVTVSVETQSLNSDLDSDVLLGAAVGFFANVLSFNDDSGLINVRDSFIRTVIPSSGDYLVRLDDRFSRGGAEFTYRVHLNVFSSGDPELGPPELQSITPDFGQRGTIVNVSLNGSNLSDTISLDFAPADGISVQNLQASFNQVTASLTIGEDAGLGMRQVAVTTPLGTSNTLPFTLTEADGEPGSINGEWAGMTSQDKVLEFTVDDNTIKRVKFAGTVQGAGCGANFETETQTSRPITDNAFELTVNAGPGGVTFTFSGMFTSSSAANGNLSMRLNGIPGVPSCSGNANTTWSANKQ